jgi:hypothetical protein
MPLVVIGAETILRVGILQMLIVEKMRVARKWYTQMEQFTRFVLIFKLEKFLFLWHKVSKHLIGTT